MTRTPSAHNRPPTLSDERSNKALDREIAKLVALIHKHPEIVEQARLVHDLHQRVGFADGGEIDEECASSQDPEACMRGKRERHEAMVGFAKHVAKSLATKAFPPLAMIL